MKGVARRAGSSVTDDTNSHDATRQFSRVGSGVWIGHETCTSSLFVCATGRQLRARIANLLASAQTPQGFRLPWIARGMVNRGKRSRRKFATAWNSYQSLIAFAVHQIRQSVTSLLHASLHLSAHLSSHLCVSTLSRFRGFRNSYQRLPLISMHLWTSGAHNRSPFACRENVDFSRLLTLWFILHQVSFFCKRQHHAAINYESFFRPLSD